MPWGRSGSSSGGSRAWAGAAFAVAAILGCTPSGSASKSPASAAAPALQEPAPRAPLRFVDDLPPLPASEKEKLSLLRDVCPLAVRTKGDHSEVGCSECYSAEGNRRTGGRVASNPDPFYGVDAVVRGAFSGAGADEVAVSLEGCEPHSQNWGGLLILRPQQGTAVVVEYFSGVHPHACKAYRKKDGRDLLVCSRTDGNQGTFHDFLSSFDPVRAKAAQDLELGFDQLLETLDVTGGACWSVNEPAAEPVTRSAIESFTFRDLNRDGALDLVVEVNHFREQSRAAMVAHCQAAEKAEQEETPMPAPPMRLTGREVVEFLFDGGRFVRRKK